MAIVKEARTPSKDPLQEKLRQNKANWNKEVSEFINNLIHLKKTMNGWPSKFFKERSKIIAPIPADPNTILGALAGDFNDLVNRGNSIIQDQINYAKNRKQPGQKGNVPANDNGTLQNALEADDQSYYLVSEASNPLSRFFTRLFTRRIGEDEKAQINRARISLLNASANLYKDLAHFQAAVVGSSAESIFTASKLFDKVENNWAFIISGINMAQQQISFNAEKKNTQSLEQSDNPAVSNFTDNFNKILKIFNIKAICTGYQEDGTNRYYDIQLLLDGKVSDIKKYQNEIALALKGYKPVIKVLHDQGLIRFEFSVKEDNANEQLNQSLKNTTKTEELGIKNKENIDKKVEKKSELETQSQQLLNRWTGKLNHSLSLFDKTSDLRINVYNLTKELRKEIQKIMNSLEDGLNVDQLLDIVSGIDNNLKHIKTGLHVLISAINGSGFSNKYIDLLEKGKLTDHPINFDQTQKEHLDRMLRRKQLQDISKMYGKKP